MSFFDLYFSLGRVSHILLYILYKIEYIFTKQKNNAFHSKYSGTPRGLCSHSLHKNKRNSIFRIDFSRQKNFYLYKSAYNHILNLYQNLDTRSKLLDKGLHTSHRSFRFRHAVMPDRMRLTARMMHTKREPCMLGAYTVFSVWYHCHHIEKAYRAECVVSFDDNCTRLRIHYNHI